VRLKLADIPDDVIEEYQLADKATKYRFVFVEIRKGMYGLPQAGLLAQELLEERLAAEEYYQSTHTHTPGLWTHAWRPIQFSLVVDDFGVKYVGEENKQHLVAALEEFYSISKDEQGKKYVGLTLDWNYEGRQVHLSMPGYVEKALKQFQHQGPGKPQNQPHPHIPPTKAQKYNTPSQGKTPLSSPRRERPTPNR